MKVNQALLWSAVAGGLLGGCGPSSSVLLVEVREAETRAPVVGAGVEADSYAPGMSLKLGDVVDQSMGKRDAVESRGITDGRGRVELKWVRGRSVRVVVLAIGQPPAQVFFERDLDAGPSGWKAAETSEHGPGLEVRAEPK